MVSYIAGMEGVKKPFLNETSYSMHFKGNDAQERRKMMIKTEAIIYKGRDFESVEGNGSGDGSWGEDHTIWCYSP